MSYLRGCSCRARASTWSFWDMLGKKSKFRKFRFFFRKCLKNIKFRQRIYSKPHSDHFRDIFIKPPCTKTSIWTNFLQTSSKCFQPWPNLRWAVVRSRWSRIRCQESNLIDLGWAVAPWSKFHPVTRTFLVLKGLIYGAMLILKLLEKMILPAFRVWPLWVWTSVAWRLLTRPRFWNSPLWESWTLLEICWAPRARPGWTLGNSKFCCFIRIHEECAKNNKKGVLIKTSFLQCHLVFFLAFFICFKI